MGRPRIFVHTVYVRLIIFLLTFFNAFCVIFEILLHVAFFLKEHLAIALIETDTRSFIRFCLKFILFYTALSRLSFAVFTSLSLFYKHILIMSEKTQSITTPKNTDILL